MKTILAIFLLTTTLMAQAAGHSATLNWTASTDGGSYNVYRANAACSSNPTLTKIGSTATGVTNYVDSTVTVGTWCYAVTAVVSSAESGDSNLAPGVVLPSPPTALTVTVN